MAYFFLRFFNLLIKNLARPVINQLTSYQKIKLKDTSNHKGIVAYICRAFRIIGYKGHEVTFRINKRFFNLSSEQYIQLTQEKALEKGIELSSEIFIYSLLIIIPVIEMKKKYDESKKDLQGKAEFLSDIYKDIRILTERDLVLKKRIEDVIAEIAQIDENRPNTSLI